MHTRISTTLIIGLTFFSSIASAQGVSVSSGRGSDGCPEVRVQNNGRKFVDVDVEYTIQQRKSNGRTVGGTRTDTMDDIPPGGRARTFPTYVFGAACDAQYDFQHRGVRVRER